MKTIALFKPVSSIKAITYLRTRYCNNPDADYIYQSSKWLTPNDRHDNEFVLFLAPKQFDCSMNQCLFQGLLCDLLFESEPTARIGYGGEHDQHFNGQPW